MDAVETPLFHNAALKKRVNLSEARAIVDWMARAEEDGGGGKRAEWVEGLAGKEKTLAWIWWRRPEEWAAMIAGWVSTLTLVIRRWTVEIYKRASSLIDWTCVLGRGDGPEEYGFDSI